MKKTIIISIVAVVSLFGCTEKEIDINRILSLGNGEMPEIMIIGYVSSELATQKVKVYQIDNLGETAPISDAKVFVTDGETTFEYILSEQAGLYISKTPFRGFAGNSYTLNVTTKDDKNYTSTGVMVGIDPAFSFPVNKFRFLGSDVMMYCEEHYFGFNEPEIWAVVENHGLPTSPPVELNFFDVFFLIYNHSGYSMQGALGVISNTNVIHARLTDTVELIKMSVSDNYYKYLVSMFNITDWSAGMFSTIPGNPETNVSQGGTGYFYATDVKRYRVTYKELKDSLIANGITLEEPNY